jgi:hypothetical protein
MGYILLCSLTLVSLLLYCTAIKIRFFLSYRCPEHINEFVSTVLTQTAAVISSTPMRGDTHRGGRNTNSGIAMLPCPTQHNSY